MYIDNYFEDSPIGVSSIEKIKVKAKLYGDNDQKIGCIKFKAKVDSRYVAGDLLLTYSTTTFNRLKSRLVLIIINVIETLMFSGCGDTTVSPPYPNNFTTSPLYSNFFAGPQSPIHSPLQKANPPWGHGNVSAYYLPDTSIIQ